MHVDCSAVLQTVSAILPFLGWNDAHINCQLNFLTIDSSSGFLASAYVNLFAPATYFVPLNTSAPSLQFGSLSVYGPQNTQACPIVSSPEPSATVIPPPTPTIPLIFESNLAMVNDGNSSRPPRFSVSFTGSLVSNLFSILSPIDSFHGSDVAANIVRMVQAVVDQRSALLGVIATQLIVIFSLLRTPPSSDSGSVRADSQRSGASKVCLIRCHVNAHCTY